MTDVARCPVDHGRDFTDPDLIQSGVPLPEFAYLRENRPLYWNPQTKENSSFDDGGFWLATRWEDVRAISSAREGWSSEENTAIVKFQGHIGRDERDVQRMMMINMDDPHHAKVRGIVSRGVFTPRGVSKIEDALRERAVRIVTEAKAKGVGNFVDDVACELPLQALADLMGFPQDDRKQIFDWSNQMMAYDDPDYEVDPARSESFYASIRRYWPGLPDEALVPDYSGIRPKLTGPGEKPADFVIEGPEEHGLKRLVALFGIESPGLTSALSIGIEVCERIGE